MKGALVDDDEKWDELLGNNNFYEVGRLLIQIFTITAFISKGRQMMLRRSSMKKNCWMNSMRCCSASKLALALRISR